MNPDKLPGSYTVLIADDHPLINQSLSHIFRRLYPDFTVLNSNTMIQTLEILRGRHVDFILLDIMLDDGISIGNIGRLKTIQPDLKVLVISNYNSDQFGQKAITMGADGYIEKKAPIVELVKAITTVMEDEEMYFKKELLYNIAFGGKQNRTLHNPFDLLSKQEFAIAVLLLQSKTRKEIATELNIRENTVSMHKASILEKLKINGVLALRELARYHNITTKK